MIPKQTLEAVYHALGAAGFLRFLQQFKLGYGDYTAERQRWLGRITLDELLAEAEQTESQVPTDVKSE